MAKAAAAAKKKSAPEPKQEAIAGTSEAKKPSAVAPAPAAAPAPVSVSAISSQLIAAYKNVTDKAEAFQRYTKDPNYQTRIGRENFDALADAIAEARALERLSAKAA